MAANRRGVRLRFVGIVRRCALLLMAGVLFPGIADAADPPGNDYFRGGKVEWARLKHAGRYWSRHAESDDVLLDFIRKNTTLDIDPVWRQAPANNLDALTQFPFLFADTLQYLTAAEQQNLTEYLRRGGFLVIDACCNQNINPDDRRFLSDHLRILGSMFPDLRVEVLPPEHIVFSIYFKMDQFPPQTASSDGLSWSDGPTNPLRLLYSGDRIIGIMSISALQCGWSIASVRDRRPNLKMMTNIYLYAMTR